LRAIVNSRPTQNNKGQLNANIRRGKNPTLPIILTIITESLMIVSWAKDLHLTKRLGQGLVPTGTKLMGIMISGGGRGELGKIL
jgi:hypothetical protein